MRQVAFIRKYGAAPMPYATLLAGGGPPTGHDRTAHYGTRTSPYGESLARRGTISTDSYSLGGVSGGLARGATRGAGMGAFTLAVGMAEVAAECQRNGFCPSGSPHGAYSARNAIEIAEYSRQVAEIIAAGGDVPEWVEQKLARARTDIGDVKHFLAYRRVLGMGGKLQVGHAAHFQEVAIRQGRVGPARGGKVTRKRMRRKKGLGALLIGACCGALDKVIG